MLLQEVTKLIDAKKDIFLDYEAITESMLDCPTEQIEDLVARRDELIAQVDALSKEIDQACARGEECYPLLDAAIKNSCAYSDLGKELQEVFTHSQEIFGVINRIRNVDPLAVRRVEGIKREMLNNIAAANTNKDANLQRYLSNSALRDQSISVFGDKYAKI